jgi:hypothetical protein
VTALKLLGEAATYEAAGASIVLDEKLWGVAKIAQEQRRATDPWEDVLDDKLNTKNGMMGMTVVHKSDDGFERVASAEILRFVLGVEYAHQTTVHGRRLGDAMRQIGWGRPDSGLVTINGRSVRGYVRRLTEAGIKADRKVVELFERKMDDPPD